MGFYTVNHSGSTKINEGTEKKPDLRAIQYERGQPLEELKRGDLDHVKGAEYHTGDHGDEKKEEKDKKK